MLPFMSMEFYVGNAIPHNFPIIQEYPFFFTTMELMIMSDVKIGYLNVCIMFSALSYLCVQVND